MDGPVKLPQQLRRHLRHRQTALPLALLRGGEGQAAEKAAVGPAPEIRIVAAGTGHIPAADPDRFAAEGTGLPPGAAAVQRGLKAGEGAHGKWSR